MIKRVIFVVLAVVALIDCTTMRGGHVVNPEHEQTPTHTPVLGQERGDSALFFYVEGLKKLYINGEVREAVEYFERAIECDSLHSVSYYEIGNAIAPRDLKRALKMSEMANSLDSTDFWYKVQLSRLLVANKEYHRAQKIYEWLIDIAPRVPENYSMLAALYEFAEQPFSAIAVLEKGETALGKLEYLSEQKQELLIKMRLYDKAIEEGVELVENHPYNYENYLTLAKLYAETKNYPLAEQNYQKAMELNPNGLDVLFSMNDFYKMVGDNPNFLATTKRLFQRDEVELEQKVAFFNEIISNRKFYGENYFAIKDLASTLYGEYPGEYVVLKIYADNMLAWGDCDGVVAIYEEYIEYNDTLSFVSPYTEIISIEAYLKNSESVKKHYKQAVQKFPRNSELHLFAGWSLSLLEGEEKATIKAYKQAYKYASTDSVKSMVLGTLGDMHYQKGRHKKGYALYKEALKLWADNVIVLNNYAYFLSEEEVKIGEKGRGLEQALWMSQRAVDLEPRNATYIDTYAWILYKLGEFEGAKKAMQQALALDASKSSTLFLHYGDILYALGDYYMATVYWTRALDADHSKEEIEQRFNLPKSKPEER